METIALLLEGHQSHLGMRGRRFTASSGRVRRGVEYNRTQRQIQLSDPNMHGALLLLFPSAGPKTIIIKKLKKMLAWLRQQGQLKAEEWRVMNCIVNGLWNDLHMEHYTGTLNNVHIVRHRSLPQAVMLFVMAIRSITLYYHDCIREKINRAQSVVSQRCDDFLYVSQTLALPTQSPPIQYETWHDYKSGSIAKLP